MDSILIKQAQKYCRHFETLFDIHCIPVDCTNNTLYLETDVTTDLCKSCEKHLGSKCYGINAFIHGCQEAYRWDGMYIYFCNLGLVLVSTFISDEKGNLSGGIVAGPLCMGNMDDSLSEIPNSDLRKIVAEMPCYPPEQIQSLAEVMSAITSYISGISHGKAGRYFYSQESLLNNIYAEKIKSFSENDYYTYPIAQERRLRSAIRNRDKEEAENVLNQILAYIYVSNNSNLEAIKPRITELMIVISRTAVDAGADMEKIDLITQNSLKHVDTFKTIEDLSAWVSNIMHSFISSTFDYDRLKHADTIHKVDKYIQTHYQHKLTLDEIASKTYLSKTYLCSIFKKETGETITNYINKVRIEKSKLLFSDEKLTIVEIANMCGFEDQSYFTKIFKSYVGMTPKKYRESRKR